MSIKRVQGDSITYNYAREDGLPFDESWTGKWAIVPRLGAIPVLGGNLTLSSDFASMQLLIEPAKMEQLLVGSYVLVVELSNAVLKYNKEVTQEVLTITPQGIAAT